MRGIKGRGERSRRVKVPVAWEMAHASEIGASINSSGGGIEPVVAVVLLQSAKVDLRSRRSGTNPKHYMVKQQGCRDQGREVVSNGIGAFDAELGSFQAAGQIMSIRSTSGSRTATYSARGGLTRVHGICLQTDPGRRTTKCQALGTGGPAACGAIVDSHRAVCRA